MPNKYELITTLYRETLNKVSNPAEWQKFLRTAGYNFRLDFDDQILLYAQKPESTAVLEVEKWNNVFGRWVNKGSTGIAFLIRKNPATEGFGISSIFPIPTKQGLQDLFQLGKFFRSLKKP